MNSEKDKSELCMCMIMPIDKNVTIEDIFKDAKALSGGTRGIEMIRAYADEIARNGEPRKTSLRDVTKETEK